MEQAPQTHRTHGLGKASGHPVIDETVEQGPPLIVEIGESLLQQGLQGIITKLSMRRGHGRQPRDDLVRAQVPV
ncbi:hypothetical protein IT087_02450 [Candidatus Uhrbacteria bacterium]|nr:hypothetical protein [Candidatus Uhrbacteria bacterium]